MNPTRRNVEQPIEEILEECRRRMAQGELAASCLADYPARTAELAPLLSLVARAQLLARDPDPRYAAAARRRFRSAVVTANQNRAARPSGFVGLLARLAVPLALVIVLSLSGLGLVQAADGSLPDSPLYPVKQASEKVGGLLANSPSSRAVYQTRVATTRESELSRALAVKKGPVLVVALAQSMVSATNLATEQALSSQGTVRQQVLAHLRPLLTAEQKDLAVVAADPHPLLAIRGRAFEQQIAADEQKLPPQ